MPPVRYSLPNRRKGFDSEEPNDNAQATQAARAEKRTEADGDTKPEQSPLRPAVAWSSLLGSFKLADNAAGTDRKPSGQGNGESHGKASPEENQNPNPPKTSKPERRQKQNP